MRRAVRSGFTLVEVMLTLLIMAGILLTVTQILTAARQSRDTIHNIQESQLAGPAILDMLERDLRGIFTYDRDPRLHLRIRDRVLSGFDADSIDFVTTTDSLIYHQETSVEDFRRADFNEVGYHLRNNPDTDDFLEIYRREDLGIDEEPFDGGQFSLLHDRVKGLDIQIYDEDGPEAEALESWGSDEDETAGLPTRIEIALTLELAPRLVREQIVLDRRTMVYRRILRFPETLREHQLDPDARPIASVPLLRPPVDPNAPGGGGGGGPGDEGGIIPPSNTETLTGDGGGGGGFGEN